MTKKTTVQHGWIVREPGGQYLKDSFYAEYEEPGKGRVRSQAFYSPAEAIDWWEKRLQRQINLIRTPIGAFRVVTIEERREPHLEQREHTRPHQQLRVTDADRSEAELAAISADRVVARDPIRTELERNLERLLVEYRFNHKQDSVRDTDGSLLWSLWERGTITVRVDAFGWKLYAGASEDYHGRQPLSLKRALKGL